MIKTFTTSKKIVIYVADFGIREKNVQMSRSKLKKLTRKLMFESFLVDVFGFADH